MKSQKGQNLLSHHSNSKPGQSHKLCLLFTWLMFCTVTASHFASTMVIWHADPFGASTVALSMSKVTGEDAKPETVSEALMTCIEETCSPVYRHTGGFRFAIGLVDDIITILSGHNVLVCAHCDFRRLIQAGERMLKAEKVGKTESARSSQMLGGAARKLYFITCWVHEQPNEAWASLARLVEVQKASLEELNSGRQLQKAGRKNYSQSKVLIEV